MAKEVYRVPYSINVQKWDATIPIVSKSGIGLKHPIKLWVAIAAVAMGFLVPLAVWSNTPVKEGGVLSQVLLLAGWEMLVFMLLTPQSNGLDGWRWILPTIQYWLTTSERQISTEGESEVEPVRDVLRLADVDSDGIIRFTDGWRGVAYKVDGYASNMLFRDETNTVVNAFERYLRTLPPNTTVSIPTQFRTLRVDEQIHYASQRATMNSERSDLSYVASERLRILEHVASNNMFSVITQWMIISCSDEPTLDDQMMWFETQVYNGLARSAVRTDQEETIELLSSIYRP